jgi:hypothetical protein
MMMGTVGLSSEFKLPVIGPSLRRFFFMFSRVLLYSWPGATEVFYKELRISVKALGVRPGASRDSP